MSMPDILVWAPEGEGDEPICAFSSRSSLQYEYDPVPPSYTSDERNSVRSRRSSLNYSLDGVNEMSAQEIIAWTREILQNSNPHPPPSSRSTSVLSRAATFLRSWRGRPKRDKQVSSKALIPSVFEAGIPPVMTTRSRSGTITQHVSDAQQQNGTFAKSASLMPKEKKRRSSIFMFPSRNDSSPALSSGSVSNTRPFGVLVPRRSFSDPSDTGAHQNAPNPLPSGVSSSSIQEKATPYVQSNPYREGLSVDSEPTSPTNSDSSSVDTPADLIQRDLTFVGSNLTKTDIQYGYWH